MQRSTSHSALGAGTRSIAVSSLQKFENVDKLHNVVTQLQQTSSKNAPPEQILDLIKNKIKTNYNTLYENYDVNKNEILRNIQQAENTNITENTMKNKLQHVIKQKALYDKIKAQVEYKQKKLHQLLDLRQQLKNVNGSNSQLKNELADRISVLNQLEKYKEILDYEAAVLKNMQNQRNTIQKMLKERHEQMRKQENTKKTRIIKLKDCTHTKKIILQGIEDKIAKQDTCELPQTLNQQLQKKLEFYQGKYAQQNILQHETKLSQARYEIQKNIYERQNQRNRMIRLSREKQEKQQLENVNRHLLFRQSEEEKIKVLCGVSEITELVTNNLEPERQNLEHISKQLEQQIENIRSCTRLIEEETQKIMTDIKIIHQKPNLLSLEKELDAEQTKLRRLKLHMNKKEESMNQWKYILQVTHSLIDSNPGDLDKFSCIHKIKEAIPKLEQLANKQKLLSVNNTIAFQNRFDQLYNRKLSQSQSQNYE